MKVTDNGLPEITIALLGIGTVGTGVVRLLQENAERIEARLGARVVVKSVACMDLSKERASEVDKTLLTDRIDEVLSDPDVDVIVELIGGSERVLDYLFHAIRQRKHIVTANKALLAEHGVSLMAEAKNHHVDLFYEASVGGGIPIIRAIREALASDRIIALYGIINGTTNYILSRMTQEGRELNDVLAEAARLGYAEADPSLDIDGHDAAQKLAIISALAFGIQVTPELIYTEGIRHISALDIAWAAEMGYVIKLLAVAFEHDGAVDVRVHPALVPKTNMLSHVNGVYNAVLLHCQASGLQLMVGKGAGMMPTASAVVSDVIEVSRNLLQSRHGRIPGFGYHDDGRSPLQLFPLSKVSSRYYFRMSVEDRPGVLGQIATILGEHHISIAELKQSGLSVNGAVPVVVLTHMALEGDVRAALTKIDALDVTLAQTRLIRVVAPEVVE